MLMWRVRFVLDAMPIISNFIALWLSWCGMVMWPII
jgi:hypothetical protein